MEIGGKGGSCLGKILFHCHLQHHHFCINCPEIDQRHLRWTDARNSMRSGTAIYCCCNVSVSYIVAGRATWSYVGNINWFLISNFRRVLKLVYILLGISPASDCGFPTFRNPLSVPSSRAGCKVWSIRHTLHPSLKDGADRGFRNVGKPQSDAGEIPKRIHIRTLTEFL